MTQHKYINPIEGDTLKFVFMVKHPKNAALQYLYFSHSRIEYTFLCMVQVKKHYCHHHEKSINTPNSSPFCFSSNQELPNVIALQHTSVKSCWFTFYSATSWQLMLSKGAVKACLKGFKHRAPWKYENKWRQKDQLAAYSVSRNRER